MGAVFALIDAARGETTEQALEDALQLGLHSPSLIEAVRRVTGARSETH